MMNETGEQREHGKWLDDDTCTTVGEERRGALSRAECGGGSHCLVGLSVCLDCLRVRWVANSKVEHCKTLTLNGVWRGGGSGCCVAN